MAQYIDKSDVMAEIEKGITSLEGIGSENYLHDNYPEQYAMLVTLKSLKFSLDTLEVKEVDLNNGIQLTWEDMRELYIIFAEVDTEIELCKCDIQTETIGYYQEVLKRFKAQKGE